jgi:predicted MFS family arabinose efflux permease
MSRIKSLTYEHRLVSIFFLSWGLIFLDRQALSILLPLMINDIPLTNTEIGQINMWQTICYAISAPIFALLADRIGNRKRILLIGIFATSGLTAVTMLAESVGFLIVVRALLGASEGVILPIAVTLVALASRPDRLGRNVGLVYAGAAVIAATIGPTFVTQIAIATTWRIAFLIISVLSVLAGVLVWALVRDAAPSAAAAPGGAGPTTAALRAAVGNRNVLVCVAISVFAMAGLWTILSFIPLYLTQVSQLPVSTAGFVMSLFGIFTIFWQILLPYSSDRIGRKPAMLGYATLAGVTPALLFLFPHSPATLAVYVVIGGIFLTLTSLFTSIIPVESVAPSVMATAGALIMGIGELLGAFVVGAAGSLADSYGLRSVMAAAAVAYVVVVLVSLGLKETRKRNVPIPAEAAVT